MTALYILIGVLAFFGIVSYLSRTPGLPEANSVESEQGEACDMCYSGKMEIYRCINQACAQYHEETGSKRCPQWWDGGCGQDTEFVEYRDCGECNGTGYR